MTTLDRETTINRELIQLSLDQESNQKEIRQLAELETEYASLAAMETAYFNELIDSNYQSEDRSFFSRLEEDTRRLQREQKQQLDKQEQVLFQQKKELENTEERLLKERRELLKAEQKEGENT